MKASLGLGTVQFGSAYGIANRGIRVENDQIGAILDEGCIHGVSILDTATLYGDCEERLGRHDVARFSVVTKTPQLADITPIEAQHRLRSTFALSLSHLRLPSLYGLLVHSVGDLIGATGPAIYEEMVKLKEVGLTQKIGVSVYTAADIDFVMEHYKLDIVQLPVNVLDQRLVKSGHIAALGDAGIEVHARSAFLQGLLLMDVDAIPVHFSPFRRFLSRWHEAAVAQGLDRQAAALIYLRDLPGVSVVLVGVTSRSQMRDAIKSFSHDGHFSAEGLGVEEPALVDPRTWRWN